MSCWRSMSVVSGVRLHRPEGAEDSGSALRFVRRPVRILALPRAVAASRFAEDAASLALLEGVSEEMAAIGAHAFAQQFAYGPASPVVGVEVHLGAARGRKCS